ncbi:MAG: histidine kinase [Chloroflexota bacterium]|nr:histidine kinase [Chloroflexota bacterium]
MLLAYLPQLTRPAGIDLGVAAELIVLAVIAQHFPMPFGPQHKTDASIAVYFAAVLLFEAPVAVVLVGTSHLLGQATLAVRRSPTTGKRMRGLRGVLFNTSQLVLSTALSSLVYYVLVPHSGPAPLDRLENLWAIPTAALAMYLANGLAVAVMVGLQLGHPPRKVWLSVWNGPQLEKVGLFLIGLVAAISASRYAGAPLVMALPAAILFQAQRRSQDLLASEQLARAEAEQAQAHLAFLANASAVLALSLDYETTLQNAVRLAVPYLADSCSITIGNGETACRCFAVTHAGAQEERVGELLRRCPSAPSAADGARSEIYPVVSEALFGVWAPGAESVSLLRELGPLSAMLVPLSARGQTLGGLAVYTTLSKRKYGSSDLAVAEDLAQRMALAIDNARLYEEQQRIVGRLRELRGQLEVTERARLLDDERKRIARELHDRVEQTFFSIELRVSALVANPRALLVGSMRDALAEIQSSANQGAEDLRAAIFALTRAEVHDLGLVRALWQLVREFQERTGIEADLIESGAERRAPPEIAEVLHAVAREGLANVEQHAQATAVVVSLRFELDAATLTVQDDGVGAPALVLSMLADSATRFGLSGLSEQVVRVGGTFTAGPADDGGFIVRARVQFRDSSNRVDAHSEPSHR